MGTILTCDQCERTILKAEPAIKIRWQRGIEGEMDASRYRSGTHDFCSWTCVYDWANGLALPEGLDGRTETTTVTASAVGTQVMP